ncbi:hypothetical protein SNE40_008498 [Patella caerulea]|uniref:Sulfotransferase domain-containing protein n=1 Tax=Patella caerulea TaxID=87958 RepID=A0AAN8PWN0_PATCE
MDTSSELLSMDVPRYNPKFKNPCWYEDLTDYDVYSNNKFAEYYHSVKSVFIKLSSHWKKKFAEETNPRRLRCLPYFFIAGQPKCGSTDLYKKLISHPDVGSPPIKECHWWGKNRYGWRSNYTTSLPFSDYIDLFDGVSNDIETRSKGQDISNIITGDASVSTLWDNDEWWRLKENCGHTEPKYTNANYVHHFLPNAKIIIVLRDPVDRLWSDYLYFQKTSKSAEDFHMNAAKAISFHINCTQKYTLTACIYNRTLANLARVRLRIGIYYAYLENWLNIYPRDQFLVIRLEDYAVNTRNIMKNVFRFLKLRDLTKAESDFIIGQPVANSRRKGDKKYGTMNESTRKMLEDFYEPYNKRLALLLNDNRYMWKNKDRTSAGAGNVQESRDPRVRS